MCGTTRVVSVGCRAQTERIVVVRFLSLVSGAGIYESFWLVTVDCDKFVQYLEIFFFFQIHSMIRMYVIT